MEANETTANALRLQTAYTTILACYAITIGLVIVFRFYLVWENARRDKEQGVKIDPEEVRRVNISTDDDVLQVDQTDKENRSFRYIL
jgi:ACS family allantoate permease-like MFS transporter